MYVETKNSAPLEKKPKKVNVDRVSYRQERVELSVVDFVQSLLLQDSDSNATDVVANIVEVMVLELHCQPRGEGGCTGYAH